jgi:hypothetical protein
MALRTRRPTGVVPWPLILVEGPEKSGKTWLSLQLSASDRIGRTVLVELGAEGVADQYKNIPGASYEIAEHNGTFEGLAEVIRDATDEARKELAAGNKPMLLVIDTATEEWDLLKAIAESRARRSKFNRDRLQKDPTAEVVVDMSQWNYVTEMHYEQFIEPLKAFPGIVIVTARGKEVAAMDGNGRPVANTKTYKVEGQKNLGYDVSAWVQLSRNAAPTVVGMRSVLHGIRPGKDAPVQDADLTLERLIFDLMGCDPKTAEPANIPTRSALQVAKAECWAAAQKMNYDQAKLAEVFAFECDGATLETGTVEQFNHCRDFLLSCLEPGDEPAGLKAVA